MVTVGENKCPKCGGRIDIYRQDDPMSFNDTTIFKHVCSSCGYVLSYKEGGEPETATTETEDCPICRNPLVKDELTGKVCCISCSYQEDVHNQTNTTTNGLYGWICPKCGAVMSPYQSFCINCSRQNWEITYSTNLTNNNTVSQHEQNVQDSKFMQIVNALNRGELPPI